MNGRDGRLRLRILGGFLGAGKSTWLRHAVHHDAIDDVVVVVNEAASAAVDDVLLARAANLEVLAGGCACCSARGRLIALLRRLCDHRLGAGLEGSPERVVLETSGLADPAAIIEAVTHDPVLQHHVLVEATTVIVDAVHGLEQMRREALSRRQVSAADRIVISKLDQTDAPALCRLVATLRARNPGADLTGSILGEPAPLPDATGIAPERLADAAAEEAPLLAETLALGGAEQWPALGLWLSALIHARGDDIVRIKGVVRTPRAPLLLQSVRKVVQSPEILPEAAAQGESRLVLIGRGFTATALHRSLKRFGVVVAASGSPR